VPDSTPHTYVVNAAANIRSLNRMMNWHLPVEEAKTLNGLILEQLEEIPEKGADLQLGAYRVEILKTSDNAINLVRIRLPERPAA
jgi:Mg2+/Co2+ transporter CorB